MRRFGWLLGCALLMCAGSTTPVLAQGNDNLGRNWDIRAGFFLPERQAARAAEGDIWFTIGAEKPIYVTDRWTASFSIDYYGAGPIYNVPLRVNLNGETNRLRYGVGLGLGISHDLGQGITGFTYDLTAGYTLLEGANPITADFKYNWLSTGGGMLNGWTVTFGYHF